MTGSAAAQNGTIFGKTGGFLRFFGGSRKTLAAGSLFALAACGQPAPIILTPPASLLTCKAAPAIPETLPAQGTAERDKATVALWLAEREAGADCRSQLSGVARWVAEVGKN